MEITIDKAIDIMERYEMYGFNAQKDGRNKAIDTMRKYQQLQADYENRLKADLKAILVELQLEIEEIKPLTPTDDEDWQYGCFHGIELMQDKCLRLIQQKINSLKEDENEN